MKDNRYAFSIIFSSISFIASIVTLAVVLPRVQLGLDYLGIIVTILGILTTVLLGWQLYNAFKLEDEANKVEAANKNIENYAKQVAEVRSFLNYVDSPEWIYVITDSEEKILFGIKREDGAIDWKVGIPEPIRNELEALKKRIAELEKK